MNNRRTGLGTYTCNGVTPIHAKKIEYEDMKERNVLALMVFLTPAVLIIGFIATHIS